MPVGDIDEIEALVYSYGAMIDAGDMDGVVALFKDAYELVHDPVYLFNIAQSYRKVLDCIAATDYYAKYLAAAPNADRNAVDRADER